MKTRTVAACAAIAAAGALLTAPGCTSTAERLRAAQSEEWLRSQAVEVREFATDDTVVVGPSSSPKAFGTLVARWIVKTLRDNGVAATVIKRDDTSSGGVLVEGEVASIFLGDTRNPVATLLVGNFAAGSEATATCAISGKVTAAGRDLGEFHADGSETLGMFKRDTLKVLDNCLQGVGDTAATRIIAGDYNGSSE